MRTSLPILALAATFAVAACDDATTTPTEDDRLNSDIAEVVADAALEDLAVMTSAAPGLGLQAAFGPFGPNGGMGNRAALERDRTVSFFDEDGTEQEAFDELLTASVHVVTVVEGGISRDFFSATVHRSRDMWVTGLAGEESQRTWNGTGSSEVSRTRVSDENGTRSYDMDADAGIENVVRAVDREAQPWPLSGTITREVTVTIVNGPNGDETRERRTVITFDGTQFATLTVDGEEFEIDLAARQADRASRKMGQP
jgi:hypothetical protein